MWTRAEIKQRAKDVLRVNYWKAFLVALVMGLLGGSDSGGGGGSSYSRLFDSADTYDLAIIYATIMLMIMLIALLVRLIIGYALQVGGTKFFIRAAEGETNTSFLGYSFKKNRYIKIVLTMLLRDVYLFLWTLLLIIPGVIKGYSYRLVPYILADNPEIGYNRAIELSNEMTRGHKWNMFVLDLSFLGWYILGTIAFCIGVLFVAPYELATNAELYLILRDDAIKNDLTNLNELNMQPAIPEL